MMQEDHNPSHEDLDKAMRIMQISMRNTALCHVDCIGLRDLRALQALDLFDGENQPIGSEVDIAVLRDQQHSRRKSSPYGPLLVYSIEGDEPKQMLVELPMLFFSEDQVVRQGALECIENMLATNAMILTPLTTATLKASRDALISKIPEDWRQAALTMCDAFREDVFLTLAGLRQCLEAEPVIQESLNFYWPKVIHPSVTFFDSITLPIGHPEQDHKTLSVFLSDMVARSSNLGELCGEYLANFGFLPLAPSYSLAYAVSAWLASNSAVDPWHEVWQWANAVATPVARYHACSVFVLNPNLIPEKKLPNLWSEVLSIFDESKRLETEDLKCEPWALRRDLARHFMLHLEARLPESDGASIACFAWWYAEQVATLLPTDMGAAKFYREKWVKPASDLSSQVWLAASAPISCSFLRYITMTIQSPWTAALLSLMSENFDDLALIEQADDIQIRFHEVLIFNTLAALPFPSEVRDDPTFAMESSFADTVLKWAEYQTDEHQKDLEHLVEMSRELGTKDGLNSALRNLGQSNMSDQVAVCTALRAKAYTDPAIIEDIWGIISESDWRKNIFSSIDKQSFCFLFESFNTLFAGKQGKWSSQLPHYIAELCENEEDNSYRRFLFQLVLYSSLASDTVSAVQRLVRGSKKGKFTEFVIEYRLFFEFNRSAYPEWIAGKIRSLMTSMHVI